MYSLYDLSEECRFKALYGRVLLCVNANLDFRVKVKMKSEPQH